MINLPPAALFILGAFLIPLFKGRAKKVYMLSVPVISFIVLLLLPEGTYWVLKVLDYSLIFGRVDRLSIFFAYVFVIIAFGGILYAFHIKNDGEHIAAFIYIGSSLGAVFAGDLITLFIFWEIMAFSSVFLIWYQKGKAAINAGFRYIMVHICGGLFLLGGIILHIINTGSFEFGIMKGEGLASYFILISFLINAAVPPFSAWLSDSYPEATVTGAVFLSAYTTKTAVYTLIRAFPGEELLVWMGSVMTVYGVIYAFMENDIRRVLAYHIISQVGYMVTGAGIGTAMGLSGSAAHAFCHILYKALLFMGAGSVIYMTGKRKITELGGIYKSLPLTLIFYLIGGFSISAVPLFSGFVSKSMVVAASAEEHLSTTWLLLNIASSGTFLSIVMKITYFVFFGEDKGIRVKEAPINMLLGMGFLSFLCIFIGVYPNILYNVLPYPVEFAPYTGQHIAETMQILLFTALGFFLVLKRLVPEPTISLDTDWFYRKGAKAFMWFIFNPLADFGKLNEKVFFRHLPNFLLGLTGFWNIILDLRIVDGAINGIAKLTVLSGSVLRKLQSGDLQYYITLFILGLSILLVVIMIWGS